MVGSRSFPIGKVADQGRTVKLRDGGGGSWEGHEIILVVNCIVRQCACELYHPNRIMISVTLDDIFFGEGGKNQDEKPVANVL